MKSTENQSSILKLSKSSKLLPTSDDRRDFDSSLLSPRHKKLRSKSLKSYTLQNSKSIQEFSSKKPSNHLKSSKDQIQIKSFFKSHFLFNSLTEEDLFSVIDSMFFYSFLSGEIIFHQGEPGVTFYIVRSGVLEVLVNNNRINTIKEGQGFGELALMHDSVRSATVRTVTNVDLWGLSKEVFQKTLESVSVRNFQENLNFVVALPVFCGIDIKRVENFVMGLNTLNFHNGQVIIRQKDWDDLFYLVKSGIVSCSRGGYEIKKFYPGDYFGEQAVLYHSPRTATCIAVGDVQCLSINLYQLQSTLGTNIQNVMFRNTLSIILIQDPYLSKLLDSQIDSLINSIEILKCPSGSILLKKNESIDKIIMVLNGHLTSGSFTFKTLEVFGIKEAIFQSSTLLSKDLLSEEDSELGVISHQNFFKAIGGDFESVTRNNEAFKSLSQVPILKSLSKENLLALKDLMKIVKY
jgi:cGMP-dependent protein kinase